MHTKRTSAGQKTMYTFSKCNKDFALGNHQFSHFSQHTPRGIRGWGGSGPKIVHFLTKNSRTTDFSSIPQKIPFPTISKWQVAISNRAIEIS